MVAPDLCQQRSLCGALQCQQGWHRCVSCFLLKLYHFNLQFSN